MSHADLTLSKKRASKMGNLKRNASRLRAGGLAIDSIFCPTNVDDPFDTVEWDLRTAAIKGENGEVLFEQTNCEVPKFWSQLATNVVVSKYFYGENGTPERERSVKQLIHRVSRTIADWGLADGYFASAADGETFYRELTWLCLHQHGAFNSPVWFNVGLYAQYGVGQNAIGIDAETVLNSRKPLRISAGSACFIQSVNDNMEDIMNCLQRGMLFVRLRAPGPIFPPSAASRNFPAAASPAAPLLHAGLRSDCSCESGGKHAPQNARSRSDILTSWFIECKARGKQSPGADRKGGYGPTSTVKPTVPLLFQNAIFGPRQR